jgi:hypothetical protein
MKKKIISWDTFTAAVARQEPWLSRSWFAFTNDGVVLLSEEGEAEEPAPSILDSGAAR